MHSTRGKHLIAEYFGCDSSTIDDLNHLKSLLTSAVKKAGMTIIDTKFHKFTPQGVSGVILLAESHLSVHTWPEFNYAAVDVYTCGRGDLTTAHAVISEGVNATDFKLIILDRGI